MISQQLLSLIRGLDVFNVSEVSRMIAVTLTLQTVTDICFNCFKE